MRKDSEDGKNAGIRSRSALTTECLNGGTALETWTDQNGDGFYESNVDSRFQIAVVVCNGMNGSSSGGIISSGPVGAMVSGKVYSTCHHDYLYLGNGWLLFRHQANGTADQGAGTTGFNVWNVDISDFLLVSETGAGAQVTYCTMKYNKAAKTLSYTVNDNTDGKKGQTGTIQLAQ